MTENYNDNDDDSDGDYEKKKESGIRETKNLLTDMDSSTDTKKILLRRNSPKKLTFFVRRFYTLY